MEVVEGVRGDTDNRAVSFRGVYKSEHNRDDTSDHIKKNHCRAASQHQTAIYKKMHPKTTKDLWKNQSENESEEECAWEKHGN